MYYIAYNILSTPSTLAKNTIYTCILFLLTLFNMHIMNLLYYVHCTLTPSTYTYTILQYIYLIFLALLRSLGIQIGRVMDHSFTSGLRGTALSTRQYVVVRSQPPPMMNWRPGRKWFFSPPWPGTHQTTFTMVKKLPCFTSCCHT